MLRDEVLAAFKGKLGQAHPHAGRPGKRGGSAPSLQRSAQIDTSTFEPSGSPETYNFDAQVTPTEHKVIQSKDDAIARLVELGFKPGYVRVDIEGNALAETMSEVEDSLHAWRELVPSFQVGDLGLSLLAKYEGANAAYHPWANAIFIDNRHGEALMHELAHFWDARMAWGKDGQGTRGMRYVSEAASRPTDFIKLHPQMGRLMDAIEATPEYDGWKTWPKHDYYTNRAELFARAVDEYMYFRSPAHRESIRNNWPGWRGMPDDKLALGEFWIKPSEFKDKIAPLVEDVLGVKTPLGKHFNPDEARDDHGRWTDANLAGQHHIADFPGLEKWIKANDAWTKPGKLRAAVQETLNKLSIWDLKSSKWNDEKRGYNDRYEFDVLPRLTDTVEQRDDSDLPWDDPNKFGGVNYVDTAVENDPSYTEEIPPTFQALEARGDLFRGMQHEELGNALKNGYFKSTGDYNFSDQQGQTLAGDTIRQARSYAGGFAPIQHLPTFDRPAYVVAFKRGEVTWEKNSSQEWYTTDPIPLSSVEGVMEVRTYKIKPGSIEVTRDGYEGGRSNPSVWNRYRDVTDDFKRAMGGETLKDLVRKHFNPNEPRNERGEWDRTGFVGPHGRTRVNLDDIPGLNEWIQKEGWDDAGRDDLRRVAQVVFGKLSNWQLKPSPKTQDDDSGRFGVRILPRLVPGLEPYHVNPDPDVWDYGRSHETWVDRSVADDDRYSPEPPANFAALADKGDLFRGMQHEELENAVRDGYFKSRGAMNFENQPDQTLFADHISQASMYAVGMAPAENLPTFGRPSYIVAVKRGSTGWEKNSEGEWFTTAKVPVDQVERVLEVRPWQISEGYAEIVQDLGHAMSGSGMPPSIRYGYRDVTDEFKRAKPARTLKSLVRKSFLDHLGRPGKRGGSLPKGSVVTDPAIRQQNLMEWFGDSKVVDIHGQPLVVYHGTPTRGSESNNPYVRSEQADDEFPDFDVFDTDHTGVTDSGWLGAGTYFTPDPNFAEEFGNELKPVYLKIEHPFVIHDQNDNSPENRFDFIDSLQGLEGLPDELKIDTSFPEPQQFESQGKLVTWSLGTESYDAPDGRTLWNVIAHYTPEGEPVRRGGIVESTGRTEREAIAQYHWKDGNGGAAVRTFLSGIITQTIGAKAFTDLLKRNGYDGVMSYDQHSNSGDWNLDEVTVFDPHQIKSVVGNDGHFDPANPSILKSIVRKAFAGHAGRIGKVGGSLPRGEMSEQDKYHAQQLTHLKMGDPVTGLTDDQKRNWAGIDPAASDVKVYRGTDHNRPLERGDFVTTDRETAEFYAGPNGHVVEQTVPVEHLLYAGGSVAGKPTNLDVGGKPELVYAPPKSAQTEPESMTMAQAVNEVRDLPEERSIIIGADGKLIARLAGDKGGVDIPYQLSDAMRGADLIHNHPSNTALSNQDVEVAMQYHLHSISAVTHDGVATMDIPEDVQPWGKNGWGQWNELQQRNGDDLQDLWDYQDARYAAQDKLNRLIWDGKMKEDEALKRVQDDAWKLFAEKKGWTYHPIYP